MKNFVAALFLLMSSTSMAQSWPGKHITIINSLPVGTTPDIIGRRIAHALSEKYNITVISDNRPGAGGLVGLQHFVGLNNKDGRILFIGDSSNFIHAPLLYGKEALVKQVKPVSALYTVNPVVVTSTVPGTKLNRDHVTNHPFYGSWGNGSWGHICGVEITAKFGVKAQHVPYKNVGQWFADLSNDIMSFSCTTIGTSTPSVQAGKLKHVAVTSKKRDPLLPEVPTMKEAFGKEITTNEQWVAMYAGHAVPDDVLELISVTVQDIVKTPAMTHAIKEVYGHPFIISRSDFTKLFQDEYKQTKTLLKKYQIRVD
jgi:tripartite-type tricarboxylate transporter receptor subunit TctC